MFTVHYPEDNLSTEKHTYPVCAFTKDVSEEERAGNPSHFNILTRIGTELKLMRSFGRCQRYLFLRPRQSRRRWPTDT